MLTDSRLGNGLSTSIAVWYRVLLFPCIWSLYTCTSSLLLVDATSLQHRMALPVSTIDKLAISHTLVRLLLPPTEICSLSTNGHLITDGHFEIFRVFSTILILFYDVVVFAAFKTSTSLVCSTVFEASWFVFIAFFFCRFHRIPVGSRTRLHVNDAGSKKNE